MQVIWTPEALQDRLDIWEYIATENPRAAVYMDELFSAAASSLANFPDKGRLGSGRRHPQADPSRELPPRLSD